MNKILNIYKPIGLTPYQLIEKLRTYKPEYKNVKIGFAGRLDPLAHGVMLLMIGAETKNRDNYLGLPKEYEFEILFGIKTDTYDVLGILQNNQLSKIPENLEEQTKKFVGTKIGKYIQKYPPYSSKTVNGKPLFQWSRENKLSEIKIPSREIEIYNLELLNMEGTSSNIIKDKIFNNINKVSGDFRQKEIIEHWKDFFEKNLISNFKTARFKVKCSSGTYVRSIANELGIQLGSCAVTLEILRTNVGKYNLKESLKL